MEVGRLSTGKATDWAGSKERWVRDWCGGVGVALEEGEGVVGGVG